MAEPAYAWVSLDALRDLIAYADATRETVLGHRDRGPGARAYSAEVFRARITALGVPGLLPDEDGNG